MVASDSMGYWNIPNIAMMCDFVCWVAVVGMIAAFVLSLADKWGIIEYLQIHAPNDFLNKLFSCPFCCSWWVGVAISLSLLLVTKEWFFLAVPLCSTILTRELWRR